MANIDLIWSKLTAFTEQNISALDDSLPGVYRISYKHPDTKVYVFFVGKSEDIKNAFKQHMSPAEPNQGIQSYVKGNECFFKYTQVPDQKQRDIVYGLVVKFYQPSCNTERPEPDENFTININ